MSAMLMPLYGQTMEQNTKTARAAVKAATVFFRGAELTQTASVVLDKGQNDVVIEGLSPDTDVNSIKVSAGGVVISAFEFSVDYLSDAKMLAPSVERLEEQVRAKQAELDNVDIDIRTNTNLLQYLQAGVTKNVSGSEKGMGIDELKKTMEYYKAQAVELERAQFALNKKKSELQQELDNLNRQLAQETVGSRKTSGVLKLAVSASQPGNSVFTVKCYSPAAGWTPYYDINVASIEKPVEIAARSKVWQTTGLDWDKVRLTLSTSMPTSGKVAPLFSTWFLEEVVSDRIRGAASRKMAELAVQNSYTYAEESNAAEPTADEQEIYDYVERSENDLNITYDIALPYTIPGNGKQQNVDISRMEAPAEYKYYTAPKLDAEVYLLAEIADWQKLGILSGNANITYDGTYLGATYLDASSTRDKLSLTLGTDSRVTVKREKVDDYSAKKTFGGDIQQTFTYKITVRNNQNKAVAIVVKDQYPRSTRKDVTVTLQKDTTPWTANIEETGIMTWERELAAGQSESYQLKYVVRYPKDMNINL